MEIYICPKCGSDLQALVYATYPPIHAYVCSKCDWRFEEDQDEEIKRVPFINVSEA